MQHASARITLQAILAGTGFGPRALAMGHAAQLATDSLAEPARAWLEAATKLPADPLPKEEPEPIRSAVPEELRDVCQQLAPLIIEHPVDGGSQMASLLLLTDLWPHASRDERLRLRRRWLAGLMTRRAPQGSAVSTSLLREWNRNLPTSHAANEPSLADLQGLLSEPTAEGAFRTIALHISPNTDFRTLSHVVGSLAVQVLQNRFDHGGFALRCLMGAIACERLAPVMPPDKLATILNQIGHSIWWCNNALKPLRPDQGDQHQVVTDAIDAGDATAATRAARALARPQDQLWPAATTVINDTMQRGHATWPRALAALAAADRRTGAHPLGPDDAAAMAASLAAVRYLSSETTSS